MSKVFGISPEQKRCIDELFAKNGNRLSADGLLAAAKSKASPLHDLFPWSDKEAAHKYRLRQAARILKSYMGLPDQGKNVANPPAADPVPLAFKVRPTPDEAEIFVKAAIVLQDEYMRLQVRSSRITNVKKAVKQLLVLRELRPLADQILVVIDQYKIPSEEPATETPKPHQRQVAV